MNFRLFFGWALVYIGGLIAFLMLWFVFYSMWDSMWEYQRYKMSLWIGGLPFLFGVLFIYTGCIQILKAERKIETERADPSANKGLNDLKS